MQAAAALTHEAGAEWRRGAHALRATVFHTDATDEIHLDPFSTGVGNTNLPPTRRRGVELDGAWQAAAGLRLKFGYAYTDAKFREGVLAGSVFAKHQLNVAASGAARPKHKLTPGSTGNHGSDEPVRHATAVRPFMDTTANTLGVRSGLLDRGSAATLLRTLAIAGTLVRRE